MIVNELLWIVHRANNIYMAQDAIMQGISFGKEL